jgi:hypothetical protein
MARDGTCDEEREERKDAFTLRPPARIIAAIKQLAREDEIASERAMGASCLRAGRPEVGSEAPQAVRDESETLHCWRAWNAVHHLLLPVISPTGKE